MKKSFLKKGLFVFVLLFSIFISSHIEASTNVRLRVTVGENSLYDGNLSVSPCDSDNDGVVDNATAYCALNLSSLDVDGSWSVYGYFINGINGISGYADSSGDWHYWEFLTNGTYSLVGIASYVLNEGDIIWLKFLNPSDEDIRLASSPKSGGVVRDIFSNENAVDFISSKQKDDGSFGFPLYTDWVAIGMAKEEVSEEVRNKLKDFLSEQDFKAESLTDYERHAMALMSLGINPYSGTKINYIDKIISSFDGNQLGDTEMINDDIFGLIVLQNAGFGEEDEIINSLISHIISNQGDDGSWGGVDMTSAGISSIHDFMGFNGVKDSTHKAFKYLKSKETIKKNQSFGNSFSASWAIQAFRLEDWYDDEVERSVKFLTKRQENEHGHVREGEGDSILWATSYALPAISGFSWNDILVDFPKE